MIERISGAVGASATQVFSAPQGMPSLLEVLFGTALALSLAALLVLGVLLARARREARRRKEARSACLKAAGIGYWEWNPRPGDITVSGDFYRIMAGRPAPRSRTAPPLDRAGFLAMVHPEDRDDVEHALNSAMERGNELQLEHRVLQADGAVRHVLHSGSTISLPGGPPRFFAMVRDITARKLHDSRLTRSHERFMNLFKGLPLSAAIWRRRGDDFILMEISDEADLMTRSGLRLYLGRPLSEAVRALSDEYAAHVKQSYTLASTIRTETSVALGPQNSRKHLLTHYRYLPPDMVAVFSMDLTDRKVAEEALQENEMRLRKLGDNLPGGALFQAEQTADMPIRLTYMSGGLLRLAGRRPEELVGRPVEDMAFVHGDDLQRLLLMAESSARTMALVEQEVRVYAPDETMLWVRVCATPREVARNRVVWDGFVFDITRLKHVEDALRDSEARLRALGDNLPGGAIFQIERDVAGNYSFLYMSAGFTRLTGRLPEDAMANSVEAFGSVHPEDLPVLMADLEQSARAMQPLDEEYRLLHTEGRILWCRFSVVPRTASNDTLVWDGFMIDITESRNAQQELRTVLEDSPAPIVRVQLGTNGSENRISYLNPVAAELFGREALGRPCRDYICRAEQCAALASSGGRLENMPCTINCQDGLREAIRNVQVTEDGHVIEVLMDMTDQVKTQQALREARDAARAASRIKDEFLANMSHEIRTPLNGVMGMLALAMDCDMSEEQRALLRTAEESSRSLLGVINDILDITRIEAGKMDIQSAPFHLANTVRALMENFLRQADDRNVHLTSVLDPELPPWLMGDRSRVMQILFNLTGNALKFTESGEVRLEICRLGPGKSPGSVRVLFAVSDTGVGIPDDKQDVVFQAFTQADGSLSRRYGGAGLGLGIVRRLITLMDGNLAVDSETGRGTTVYASLEFGATAAEAQPEPQPSAPVESGGHARILVAEDNTVNRLLAVKLLERLGYAADSVEDGSAVLAALGDTAYAAVLMDVQMPGTNGIDATRLIRTDTSGRFDTAIPVIALTAHAMKGDRERFLEAGMTDYVAKPLDRNRLAEVLGRHAAPGTPPPDTTGHAASDTGVQPAAE